MSKDAIQVTIPTLMVISATGGPAVMVGVGAAVAIGFVGYAAYKYVASDRQISGTR